MFKNLAWKILTKKAVRSILIVVMSFLAAEQTQVALETLGVTIETDTFRNGGTLMLAGAIEALRSQIKFKTGVKWL